MPRRMLAVSASSRLASSGRIRSPLPERDAPVYQPARLPASSPPEPRRRRAGPRASLAGSTGSLTDLPPPEPKVGVARRPAQAFATTYSFTSVGAPNPWPVTSTSTSQGMTSIPARAMLWIRASIAWILDPRPATRHGRTPRSRNHPTGAPVISPARRPKASANPPDHQATRRPSRFGDARSDGRHAAVWRGVVASTCGA